MHPVASLIAENVVKYRQLLAPLLFSVLATVGNVHTPVQHSLFLIAISWAVICAPAIARAGLNSIGGNSRTPSLLAGAFLGFSQICDRAACDKQGIWATKVCTTKAIGVYMGLTLHADVGAATRGSHLSQ